MVRVAAGRPSKELVSEGFLPGGRVHAGARRVRAGRPRRGHCWPGGARHPASCGSLHVIDAAAAVPAFVAALPRCRCRGLVAQVGAIAGAPFRDARRAARVAACVAGPRQSQDSRGARRRRGGGHRRHAVGLSRPPAARTRSGDRRHQLRLARRRHPGARGRSGHRRVERCASGHRQRAIHLR